MFCFENEAGYNTITVLMRQRITFLTRFKIYAIGLVSFVLLFGFPPDALAILCRDVSFAAGWKGPPSISCDIRYVDSGGSGLDICEYKLITPISDTDWLPAP